MLVTTDLTDGVATLTLDSPKNRNALSRQMIAELGDAFQHLADDATARVVVLTHTGSTFCAGADLNDSTDGGPLPVTLLPELFRMMWHFPKPVIVQVEGAVRGGGMGLVAAADIAVASREATFAFTEVRIGVVAATVTPVVRARLTSRAMSELLLTGEKFDAERACEVGLVTRAVPASRVEHTVRSYADRLKLGAPGALRGMKALLAEELTPEWDKLIAVSEKHFLSAEAREGIAAFLAKRPPSWAE